MSQVCLISYFWIF